MLFKLSNLRSTLVLVFAFEVYCFLSLGAAWACCLKYSGKIPFLSNVGLFFPDRAVEGHLAELEHPTGELEILWSIPIEPVPISH